MKLIYLVLLLCQVCYIQSGTVYGGTNNIKTREPLFSWRQIDFTDDNELNEENIYFEPPPNQIRRANLNNNGGVHDDYIQYNNVPMGATRWKGKIFITLPRRRTGVPATLTYIVANKTRRSNIDVPLIPYPDLEVNRLRTRPVKGLTSLVSVYRTTADECDRLWMVDTGLLEYPDNRQQVQQPAIVVIDLNRNRIIHRYELPDNVLTNSSTLASIAVDVRPGSCEDTFAYIPDVSGNAIIVYNLRERRSWKFTHNSFHQDPIGGEFNLNGLEFEWDDGIFSIALGPIDRYGYRTAYYHAMASTHQFSVSTRVLRNQTNSERSFHGNDFVHLGDKGERQQTSSSVFDLDTGVLFYDLVNNNALGCWNTRKPFSSQNHVVLFQDNERFIYPSDITDDREGNIWVMTNTMPFFNYRSLNPQEINFRIWAFNVRELISNTNCA